jgi:hypothetical protein
MHWIPAKKDTEQDRALLCRWAPHSTIIFEEINLFSQDAFDPNTTREHILRLRLGLEGAVFRAIFELHDHVSLLEWTIATFAILTRRCFLFASGRRHSFGGRLSLRTLSTHARAKVVVCLSASGFGSLGDSALMTGLQTAPRSDPNGHSVLEWRWLLAFRALHGITSPMPIECNYTKIVGQDRCKLGTILFFL